LREGDRVSYEEEEGRKGKVAAKVAVIYKINFFAYECLRKRSDFQRFFFVEFFNSKISCNFKNLKMINVTCLNAIFLLIYN
jgi:hypothetical protein